MMKYTKVYLSAREYRNLPLSVKTPLKHSKRKNENNIQAVVSSDQNWGGMVFYQAGKTELFGGIETDQPAVLMVKKEKNGLSVSISDPTQKRGQIQLTLKGNYQSANPACSVSSSQGNSILKVSLPKGDEAGKTVLMELVKK